MDYEALSTTLMFAACETQACVDVKIVDDMVVELEQIFSVALQWISNIDRKITIYPAVGRIMIANNDSKSHIIFYQYYIMTLCSNFDI